jgi:hypothetical protein
MANKVLLHGEKNCQACEKNRGHQPKKLSLDFYSSTTVAWVQVMATLCNCSKFQPFADAAV